MIKKDKTAKNEEYNSGIIKIYSIENIADKGKMPVEKTTLKLSLRYRERTVGIGRYYSGMQNNIEIKKLVRCPRINSVSTQDLAVLHTGEMYKISQIQYPEDFKPPVMDLTLTEVMQKYEIT